MAPRKIKRNKRKSKKPIIFESKKKPKNNTSSDVIIVLSDSEDDRSTGTINLVDDHDDFVNTDEIMIVDPPSKSTTAAASISSSSTTSSSSKGGTTSTASAATSTTSSSSSGVTYFASAAAAGDDDDDEVQAIGEKNVMRLPHLRQHCTECKFVEDVRYKVINQRYSTTKSREQVHQGLQLNPKMCKLCYCYICDKPASECKQWGTVSQLNRDDHCHASDKGDSALYYKSLRDAAKKGTGTATGTAATAAGAAASAARAAERAEMAESVISVADAILGHRSSPPWMDMSEEEDNYDYDSYSPSSTHNRLVGPGPWQPNHAIASTVKMLTKCRKCGWFNKFSHYNAGTTKRRTDPRKADWCHACGRIACERDFEKVQSNSVSAYNSNSNPVSKVGHVSLGTKNIPFRIKARDPRKMQSATPGRQSVADRWQKYEGKDSEAEGCWKYDEVEMEEDFFLHRIGKKPTIQNILRALPITSGEDIPDTDDWNDWKLEKCSQRISFTECETMLIDDPEQMQLLWQINSSRQGSFSYNVDATWDREKRKGMLNVSLDLQKGSFDMKAKASRDRVFHHLLGSWFDVPRFKLSELTSGLIAKPLSMREKKGFLDRTDYNGNMREMSTARADELLSDWTSKEKALTKNYNDEAKTVSNKLSFQSSARTNGIGGTADSDTSFQGTLKRFAAENIFDDLILQSDCLASLSYKRGVTPVAKEMGICSAHRDICGGYNEETPNIFPTFGLSSYLGKDDQILARTLTEQIKRLRRRGTTMDGLMQQLENLGHKQVEHVEGLNVELFDFQREAVGWALERERTEGGLESFLWTKLPGQFSEYITPGGQKKKEVELYYSPVLDVFQKTKPADVRGGLIAAQMGLGKTVISLSLVLMNPAPVTPASGSAVNQISATQTAKIENSYVPTWPISARDKPSDASKNHGSIFSRGTLVVCNVSLVGQWIDEAKSKLKDPGLVYSYHGSGRKRLPHILAQNAVVVTTYATLASDAFYFKGKSNDPNYCAPCESIKWWRIICDESHTIRDVNTRNFKALSRLSAANKWCVTGTPMNTTPNDLKGQLKFIGLNHVDTMFTLFQRSMATVFKTSSRRMSFLDDSTERFAPFLFLMRNAMIRHSIGQTGRNSTTSIMSLPPKEETFIEIEYTKKERTEYDKIEQKGISLYEELKKGGNVNKHYLKLTSALLPIRLACSGGQVGEGQIKKKSADADETNSNKPKSKKTNDVLDESDILFRSKFERLLKELRDIRDKEPDSKSLVFSQFSSTLKWMQQELPKHGFQFRTLSGDMPMAKRAKALRDFQSDPPTTIFLLSLRSGAVGINLTQANRVFLMEPAMNPALEAQAVGRVYRLGQRKSVKIIRMQMKNSFESRLVGVLKKKYGEATKLNPEPTPSTAEGQESSSSSATSNGEKGDGTNEEAKATDVQFVASRDTASLGHMKSDKVTLMTEEFDALFGVKEDVVKPDQIESRGDADEDGILV